MLGITIGFGSGGVENMPKGEFSFVKLSQKKQPHGQYK